MPDSSEMGCRFTPKSPAGLTPNVSSKVRHLGLEISEFLLSRNGLVWSVDPDRFGELGCLRWCSESFGVAVVEVVEDGLAGGDDGVGAAVVDVGGGMEWSRSC